MPSYDPENRGYVPRPDDDSGWGEPFPVPAVPIQQAGKGPRVWRRSDERVRDEVCGEFDRDHELDASDIDVRCDSGDITLTGFVRDGRQKHLAELITDGIYGVKNVHNHLQLRRNATDPDNPETPDASPSTDSTVTGTTRESRTGHFGVTS